MKSGEDNKIQQFDKILDIFSKSDIMVYELYIYYSLKDIFSSMVISQKEQEKIIGFIYDYWTEYGINNIYDLCDFVIDNWEKIKDNSITKEDIWNKMC